ncbi:DNA alkylation repair protein [Aerococcaceae bacterium NML190938]|nr:DNA alkylation repair protein [Aerococcaceae bacterium NML190938]
MVTVDIIMNELQAGIHEGTVKRYKKIGEPEPYFGVPMGYISKVAKAHKQAAHLFMPLWRTRNVDAQHCAILLAVPESITNEELAECVDDTVSLNVLDKLVDKVLSKRRDATDWKHQLKASDSVISQRLGWGMEVRHIISKQANHEEVARLLAVIEAELVAAPELVKWTMNRCLVEIAVYYPELREQVLQLGEQLAVYKNMKVAKGCTSAYAPDWIKAVLKRQEI